MRKRRGRFKKVRRAKRAAKKAFKRVMRSGGGFNRSYRW